ncbi:MAG: sigma-54-dependent Fis family transcriptional regulator [Calditrichaeota bacterium]|nr:sigma-54-dependent Fis family transcriptional regulator [Calditrichota bacterium]
MSDLLLVDDAENTRKALATLLSRKGGYRVEQASNGESAIKRLREKYFDLIITDMRMKKVDGLELLRQAKKMHPTSEVIVITAYGTIESGVEAMKLGAYDYIQKDYSQEEFLLLVKRALEKHEVVKEVQLLREALREKYKFDNIIGNSDAINNVLKLAYQVAKTDSTVLLTGETGTGKELVAQAIHLSSHRRDKPMLTINCASLPENLLDSELFGHVKGSFTGAIRDKKGLFEEADLGTIFLDEIGDLAPQTQVRLLRFLQDGELRRIGENRTIRVDVRLIAATNKNLEEEVKNKTFREDLYYRLNVIPIHLPPLRQRKEDIPLLIDHFINVYAKKNRKEVNGISPSALSFFIDYDWPGNVRELENVIERSIALTRKNIINSDDLAYSFPKRIKKIKETRSEQKDMTLDEMEKWLILDTLEKYNNNQKLTAQKLDISTTTLWRKLKKYNINLGQGESET